PAAFGNEVIELPAGLICVSRGKGVSDVGWVGCCYRHRSVKRVVGDRLAWSQRALRGCQPPAHVVGIYGADGLDALTVLFGLTDNRRCAAIRVVPIGCDQAPLVSHGVQIAIGQIGHGKRAGRWQRDLCDIPLQVELVSGLEALWVCDTSWFAE